MKDGPLIKSIEQISPIWKTNLWSSSFRRNLGIANIAEDKWRSDGIAADETRRIMERVGDSYLSNIVVFSNRRSSQMTPNSITYWFGGWFATNYV